MDTPIVPIGVTSYSAALIPSLIVLMGDVSNCRRCVTKTTTAEITVMRHNVEVTVMLYWYYVDTQPFDDLVGN